MKELPKESKKESQSEGVLHLNTRSKFRPPDLIIRTKSEEDIGSKDSKREGYAKEKTVTISNVGIYEGSVTSNSVPHGKGKLKLKNGDFYEGEFQNGCFSGEGRMLSADGCEYVGEWKNNYRDGKGKEVWPNGNTFSGEFEADRKHGYGRKSLLRKIRLDGWKLLRRDL